MADIVIRSKVDVTDFLSTPSSVFEIPKETFVLNVMGMSPEESLEWEDRLNRLQKDCGGLHGTIAAFIAIAAAIIWMQLQPGSISFSNPLHVVFLIFFVFSWTTAGKIVGKWVAQRRLRKHMLDLATMI